MLKLFRIAGLGIFGYLVPRVLAGVGVPLDEWGINFGAWLGLSTPWLEEWSLTATGIIFAIVLVGIEAWWPLAGRACKRLLRVLRPDEERQQLENRFPPANPEDWQGTDPLLLWQAGCLWKNIKPRYPVEFDNPAYATFSMLLRAAEHGEFELIKREPDPHFASSHVTRHELAKYAVKKNDIPEFLNDIIANITEESEYIDLHEAATRAYEETEQTTVAQFAEMPLPSGQTAVLSWYAYALIGKGNDTRIYGKRPPSRQRRPIPTEEIPRCRFSDDARAFIRHSEKEPRFVDLEIRKSDFERRLEEIKRWNAE